MDILKRRSAALSMLADSSFRNYFIADAPFEFGAEVRRFAMGWAALTLTGSQFWVGLVTGLPGLTIVLFAPLAGVGYRVAGIGHRASGTTGRGGSLFSFLFPHSSLLTPLLIHFVPHSKEVQSQP